MFQALARARAQVLQNCGYLMVKIYNSVSARWPLTKSKKKNYRECSNLKACLSVHWWAQCHLKWPRGCKDTQITSGIKPSLPTHWKLPFDLNLKPFFCLQDYSSLIAQVEYQGQTRYTWYYTAILGCKALIVTSCHIPQRFYIMIDWKWNIFTLHNFCSMLIKPLLDLDKVKTDNLKFRRDLRDRVMDG